MLLGAAEGIAASRCSCCRLKKAARDLQTAKTMQCMLQFDAIHIKL
jgi:hypothetical protein